MARTRSFLNYFLKIILTVHHLERIAPIQNQISKLFRERRPLYAEGDTHALSAYLQGVHQKLLFAKTLRQRLKR